MQTAPPDQFGHIFPITPEFASQCGYTIAVDHRNVEFRASVLSCYVHNLVSVQRNIPNIEDYAQDAEDWALVFPEATYAESGIWQVVFHIPGGKKSMTVKEAQRMNYGINTTISRILLRAPYHTNEAQIVLIQGIPLTVIRSTSFYKEQWMVLLIDTAIACPVDGVTFTDDIIMWTVPRIFTPIVSGAVHQDNTSMGVNGIKLDPAQMAERNYTLDKNGTTLAINVPIGAQDGYFKFEKDYIIYENEVAYFGKSAPRLGPIYRLAISCHYRVNDSLHIPFEHQVNPQPTVAAGYGPLVLVLQLAKEVSYSNLYEDNDYPVVKYLAEPLYFEVQLLHNEDPQIELFLQDCWATASPDRHGIPQWPIVVNSCENKADVYETIFHPVTRNERVTYPTHFKRFEVKMFAFILPNVNTLEQVYFHCSVVLCRKEAVSGLLCPGQCVPGKQRIGRSADLEHHQQGGYVSSGAVVYMAELPTVENKIMKGDGYNSYSGTLMLIGGLAITVTLIVFGIVGHQYQMINSLH
ncbi:hypothetical protein scyTo_0000307 [Scyliorhinus torazame]|uniref:ZP domain-containing protein n=1 Tax=Scyliorhinus torazame TaxID=75743 RepID=A0A401NUZ6_SCYTO|nr:hypothetical protein [Scyliorhinus torazame]